MRRERESKGGEWNMKEERTEERKRRKEEIEK